MSFKDCIRAARAQGHITLEEALALEKRFDDIARRVLTTGEAKRKLMEEIAAEAAEKERRAPLTETRRQALEQDILGHRNARGEVAPAEALIWLHEHHGQARFEDIETRRLAILGGFHARLDGLLHELRKGALTGDMRRRFGDTKARLENVVREAFGEDSGDAAAKQLAAGWAKVADAARQRFNAAGGAVGKLEKWGLPPTPRGRKRADARSDGRGEAPANRQGQTHGHR